MGWFNSLMSSNDNGAGQQNQSDVAMQRMEQQARRNGTDLQQQQQQQQAGMGNGIFGQGIEMKPMKPEIISPPANSPAPNIPGIQVGSFDANSTGMFGTSMGDAVNLKGQLGQATMEAISKSASTMKAPSFVSRIPGMRM